MAEMGLLPMFVSYYVDGAIAWQDDQFDIVPRVGDGVNLPKGGESRYRVTDVWHVYPKRGRLDLGTHVFLECVDGTAADRPQLEFPEYYR